MQGYLNLKAYGEFANENRPAGWNLWLTFSLSSKTPEPPPATPTYHRVRCECVQSVRKQPRNTLRSCGLTGCIV